MNWLLLILLLSRYNNGCGCNNCGCSNCGCKNSFGEAFTESMSVPAAYANADTCCGQNADTTCPCANEGRRYDTFTGNTIQNRQMSMPASWQRYEMNDNNDCGCNK